MNTPGRSLYVRLTGPDFGPGAAGKWTDAATEEHGDLLDLIRLNRDLLGVREAMDEAGRFLALPRHEQNSKQTRHRATHLSCAPFVPRRPSDFRYTGRSLSACPRHYRTPRLGRSALSPAGLVPRNRDGVFRSLAGIVRRGHRPRGSITGIQRTWLDRSRPDKAPIADPRRALGRLLGNGVRFGEAHGPARHRRGHRDGARAQIGPARAADDRGALGQSPRCPRPLPPDGRGRLCAASMSPATTTRPVSRRRTGCTNAALLPASKSATSCRSMATSTSTSAVSGPRACGHISRISSSPPTGRAFCPIPAAPIRGGEPQCHFGSFGAAPEGRRAFRLRGRCASAGKEPRMRPSRAAICRRRSRVAMAPASYFPPPG